MQLITDSNNFILIRYDLRIGAATWVNGGFFVKFKQEPQWGMALGLIIFTFSLSFWNPFSFFLMVEWGRGLD